MSEELYVVNQKILTTEIHWLSRNKGVPSAPIFCGFGTHKKSKETHVNQKRPPKENHIISRKK